MTFKEMKQLYNEHFSTGYLSENINNKFALISLIGYITTHMQAKKPDVTYYQVVYKLAQGTGLNEEEIYKLAIMCEDFAYGCTEFPTFGLSPKDMPKKVKELLMDRLPF